MRRIFWLYLVVMGLMMVWYIPPFQKADEVTHFKNSAVIAGGKSGMIQNRFAQLPVKLRVTDVAFKSEERFNDSRVWEKDESKGLVEFKYTVNWKSYVNYFPVEVGVWLGSLFPYPVLSLYLGRMMGLMVFLICVWLSIRIIPRKYSRLIMIYAMIPMVIHQVTEVSYDVFLLCLAPLVLAVFLKVLKTKNFWRWVAGLSLLLLLFMSVKPGYNLVLLLLPVVFWEKYKDEITKKPWIVSIAIFVFIPVILGFIRSLEGRVGGATGLINGGYQLAIIKWDPLWVWRVISGTWTARRDFYFRGMMGFFGWLDYEFDLYQYFIVVGLVAVFLASVIKKIKQPRIGWVGWITMAGVVFGTYILIEMAMLMQWTVVGSSVVEGVQGRYLLPLVPLLLFWISQFWVLAGKRKANIIALGLVLAMLGWGMAEKINNRYYDLSSNFRDKDELKKQMEEISTNNFEVIYQSSKEKMTKLFSTADGDVIGGFEVATNKEDDGLVKVPYRYSLRDVDCKKELSWGYLDLTKINSDQTIYQQKISQLKMDFGDICFVIEPIVISDKEKYFNYVLMDEEPLVRLLHVSNGKLGL